jgi:hypothetical protein
LPAVFKLLYFLVPSSAVRRFFFFGHAVPAYFLRVRLLPFIQFLLRIRTVLVRFCARTMGTRQIRIYLPYLRARTVSQGGVPGNLRANAGLPVVCITALYRMYATDSTGARSSVHGFGSPACHHFFSGVLAFAFFTPYCTRISPHCAAFLCVAVCAVIWPAGVRGAVCRSSFYSFLGWFSTCGGVRIRVVRIQRRAMRARLFTASPCSVSATVHTCIFLVAFLILHFVQHYTCLPAFPHITVYTHTLPTI